MQEGASAFPALAPPVIPSNARDPSSPPILLSSGVGTRQGTASQLAQESPKKASWAAASGAT